MIQGGRGLARSPRSMPATRTTLANSNAGGKGQPGEHPNSWLLTLSAREAMLTPAWLANCLAYAGLGIHLFACRQVSGRAFPF